MELTFIDKCALILGLCLAAGAGYCAFNPGRQLEAPPVRPAVFVTAAAEQAHRRLLKKHGLKGEVAVLCRDVLGWYYIRNGRRYKFQ